MVDPGLKYGTGSPELQKFLMVASDVAAQIEEIPTSKKVEREQIEKLVEALKSLESIVKRMRGLGSSHDLPN